MFIFFVILLTLLSFGKLLQYRQNLKNRIQLNLLSNIQKTIYVFYVLSLFHSFLLMYATFFVLYFRKFKYKQNKIIKILLSTLWHLKLTFSIASSFVSFTLNFVHLPVVVNPTNHPNHPFNAIIAFYLVTYTMPCANTNVYIRTYCISTL